MRSALVVGVLGLGLALLGGLALDEGAESLLLLDGVAREGGVELGAEGDEGRSLDGPVGEGGVAGGRPALRDDVPDGGRLGGGRLGAVCADAGDLPRYGVRGRASLTHAAEGLNGHHSSKLPGAEEPAISC